MIIKVNFEENDKRLAANLGEIQIVTQYAEEDKYEGEYEVTPKIEAQTLPTARKYLTKDVLVNKIPYAEVSNNANGTTVTIA